MVICLLRQFAFMTSTLVPENQFPIVDIHDNGFRLIYLIDQYHLRERVMQLTLHHALYDFRKASHNR